MDEDESVAAEGAGDGPRQDHQDHQGLVHSATDRFLSSTRMLVEQVAKVGGAGAQAVVPGSVLSSAEHLLTSMRDLVESAPQVGAEVEVVMREIRAKRLTIQAIEAELAVLDDQLEILERSLAPLQAWSAQWSKVQHALLHSLDPPSDEQD